MRVVIDKAALATAIGRVQGAISEKSSGAIGLRAQGDRLDVTGSDKMLAIYCEAPCEVSEEGFLYTQAKFLSDVVKELPQGPATLEKDASWLTITAGAKNEFTIKLPLKSQSEWTDPPEPVSGDSQAVIQATRFAYMIEQIQFCVAHESPRAFGVVGYLHRTGDNRLRLVGTDSFRLSYCDAQFDLPEDFLQDGICLSKRAMGEILRMCHEGFEEVTLSLSGDGNTLLAEVEGYRIFMLLSAVQFPRYEGVIPRSLPAKVKVLRPTIQSVAKRVLLASGKTRVLHMEFAPDTLTLYSKNLGNSEGEERIQLADYKGPDCSLAINGKYLGDVFTTTTSEELQIEFKDQEDPVVIVPTQEPKGCHSRHILVPIRDSD